MKKFVLKITTFVTIFLVALMAVSCELPSEEPVKISFEGVQDEYTFKTGDEFSEEILLKDVKVTDQNGKDYKDHVVVAGLNAIPLNEDGTLKQSGSWTVKINVVIDGDAVSTKIVRVVVEYVMVETEDIIVNGDFASGSVDPFTLTNIDGSVATMDVAEEELKLVIEALSWQAAFPRVEYKDLVKLEEGKYYEVQFSARATVERDVHVQVGELLAADPWFKDELPVQYYYRLTTEMQNYSFRFEAKSELADLEKLSLLFGFGTLPGDLVSEVCDVYLDNIAIVEVDSLGEDTIAPGITANDSSVFVGTEINLAGLYTVSDNIDAEPEVTVSITDEEGNAVEAIDNTKAGVYTIKVVAKDDASNEAEKSFTLTVKEKPTATTVITNGDQAAAVANGGWIEWHDQWWCGSGVTVKEATVSPSQLVIDYSIEGTNWFALQLFYYDSAIALGEAKISLDINASAAGKVTINGNVVELVVGDNQVEVTATLVAGSASFSMQFGEEGGDPAQISAGKFVLSNLTIGETAVLSGTPTEGEGGGNTDVESNVLSFGAEADAVTNGGWKYWNDQNWCGSAVTVNEATLANNVVTLDYSQTGNCWFGMQLFYYDSALALAETKISLDINASVAGNVTINGNVVELVVGDNHVEVTATLAASKASFSMQFGVLDASQISAGKFVLSNLTFDPAQGGDVTPDPEPEVTPSELPVDIVLNSAVGGAWIYVEVKWENADDAVTAIEVGSITLASGTSVAYTGEVGVSEVTSTSYKMGAGFATAEFIVADNHKLTLTVTHATYTATYEVTFVGANDPSGVDFEIISVVKK